MTGQRSIRLVWATASVLAWSLVAGGVASATNTNMARDGSFERPSLNGAIVRAFTSGQRVGAWTVSSGSVLISTGLAGIETPPVGSQVMNLRALPIPGPGDGEICQTVSGLVPGSTYKIRFQAASAVQDSTIDVTFGAERIAHLVLRSAIPAQFLPYERLRTAVTSSESLCMHGHPVQDGAVPLVDAVRVTPSS